MSKKQEDQGLIIPTKEEQEAIAGIRLSVDAQLAKARQKDYAKDEFFEIPDQLQNLNLATVLFKVNLFLATMSRVWKQRGRMRGNWMRDLDHRVELLERDVRRLVKGDKTNVPARDKIKETKVQPLSKGVRAGGRRKPTSRKRRGK